MANWVFNPFTDELDYAGSGGGSSYIDGVADTAADLPVTQGNPPLDAVYVVKQGSGIWLINRKPAGLYCRIADNGNLDDWQYLGAFPEVNADGNWALFSSADPSKELKFDVSGVSTSTVRTLAAPDRNGRVSVSDYRLLSANANAVTGDKVAADTSAGVWTLTLPATPANGDTVTVLDYAGTFDTDNLTIARNGSNIESLADDLICEVADAAFTLVYVGSTVGWKVVPYQGTAIPSVRSDATGITGASAIDNIVTISQADYDALGSYDGGTVYIINDP
jgi:hypothetical protein